MSCRHVKVEWTLFRSTHPLVRHHHSLLFICHAYVIVVVCICHHSERLQSQNRSKLITPYLSLCFPSSPSNSTLFTLCKYGMSKHTSRKFWDSSKAHVYFITIIIIVTMIMKNIDLSLVLIYTIGAFLTLDAYRVILMQYLTFSLGILTWSTQLTKSNTVPKAMTTKINNAYICSKHAQDHYYNLNFHQMVTVIEFKR